MDNLVCVYIYIDTYTSSGTILSVVIKVLSLTHDKLRVTQGTLHIDMSHAKYCPLYIIRYYTVCAT